jgi:hypothetical protein
MINVYENVPKFENENFLLKIVSNNDVDNLFKVYSDKKAVPFFNSDNCNGDTFYYDTIEKMKKAIEFWLYSYKEKYFVRWSIIEKSTNEAIGTIELFHRDANDYFTNTGLLRLDLASDYEKVSIIEDILNLITSDTYELFYCDKIATKAISTATERIQALRNCGFISTDKCLIGGDETEYNNYYVLER